MAKYKWLYDKDYYETYALLCLNDVLNLDLILRESRYGKGHDKPDLISFDEKIGVEVTRAESQESCNATKLFQQDYPTENRKECIKNEAKRLHIEDKINIIGENPVLEQDFSTRTIQKEISDSLNQKIKKLNDDGFHIYESNKLCLFSNKKTDEVLTALQTYFKINQYTLTKHKHLFDTTYVINNDKLIIFNDINSYEIKDIKYYKKVTRKILKISK